MKFLKFSIIILAIITFSINYSYAYDRIIILSPSVADIFIKLGLKDKVYGVTKHIKGFENAKKVGSHIRPNLEIIKSLKPDFIVISSYKFFPKAFTDKINAKIYEYNPIYLQEILTHINRIGDLFDKKQEADRLIEKLKKKLLKIKKIEQKPRVIYETTQIPYLVAGKKSIVNDILLKAGAINLIDIDKKIVRYSIEKAVVLSPDIYIYQVGPMNKKPEVPSKRKIFKNLKFLELKVDEKKFARANTNSFDNVLFLNDIFYKWSQK